jgi:SPP1 family predicted phage head-tail adaptor
MFAPHQRITIQQTTTGQDTSGAEIESWATFAEVFAEKHEGSGREFFSAQKVNPELSVVFKIRYRSDLNSKMRIKLGMRILDILSISDPEDKRMFLNINCKEVI